MEEIIIFLPRNIKKRMDICNNDNSIKIGPENQK